jgi:inorganic pyrophosphatase
LINYFSKREKSVPLAAWCAIYSCLCGKDLERERGFGMVFRPVGKIWNMKLPSTFAKGDRVNAIIETPRGSCNKFNYDPDTGFFKLGKVLPAGTVFPLDFGFIPGTKGGDGDPLDVLIMMECNTYPGCWVECNILGIINIEQKKEDKKAERNDRLLAVPTEAGRKDDIKKIWDVNMNKINEIIAFLNYYKRMDGSEFRLLGVKGPDKALKMIKKSMK